MYTDFICETLIYVLQNCSFNLIHKFKWPRDCENWDSYVLIGSSICTVKLTPFYFFFFARYPYL